MLRNSMYSDLNDFLQQKTRLAITCASPEMWGWEIYCTTRATSQTNEDEPLDKKYIPIATVKEPAPKILMSQLVNFLLMTNVV